MSLAGIMQFKENLDMVMNSKAFKKATDAERLHIGYKLLNSRYGKGSIFGIVKKLGDNNGKR